MTSPRRMRAASRPPRPTPCPRLYLFVVSCPPGDGSASRRVLLVFATGEDIHSAGADAQAELRRLGWSEDELQGCQELPADPAAEADETAREAIQRARHAGFAFIAYF